MQLLNSYDDRDKAEKAEQLIDGKRRLASERDGTETIYNLFGDANWKNFYKLGMFNLPALQEIIELKKNNQKYDEEKHKEIISTLRFVVNNYDLKIPNHWI
ncbi:hypothetical protein ACUR5C_12910 [Aliikangiella sp. IMCC44653]